MATRTSVSASSIRPIHQYKTSTYAGATGTIMLEESIPGGVNKTITLVFSNFTSTGVTTIPFPVPFTSTPVTARAVNPNFSPTIYSTSAVISARSSATDGTIIVVGA